MPRRPPRGSGEAVPGAEVEGLENAEAAQRGPIVFLTVPFRAQSETLTNLNEALAAGQLLVDCTVPTAAAVSGKATADARRLAGLRRPAGPGDGPRGGDRDLGPALGQRADARRTGESSTRTSSICGDRKADKARVAALIELIAGLRAVNAGALEMARIVETLTPMLIAINSRYKTHAGHPDHRSARRRSLEVSEIERCVVLAGGTGGAKLAAGMQDLLGEGLSVIANTADDIEMLGVDVSPDPDLITYWLAGEIDEERGWGIRATASPSSSGWSRSGRPTGSASPTATWRPASTAAASSPRAGAAPTPRPRSPARSGCGPRCCRCASSRSAPGCGHAAGWRGLQEFLIADRAQAGGRGGRARGDRARPSPRPRCWRRSPSAEAIVIGPSNPVISIGPILAVAGHAGGDRGRRRAGASRSAPTSAGEVVKGPTDGFMAAVGRPSTAAGVASLYEGLIEGMVCDEARSGAAARRDRGPQLPDPDGRAGGASAPRRDGRWSLPRTCPPA